MITELIQYSMSAAIGNFGSLVVHQFLQFDQDSFALTPMGPLIHLVYTHGTGDRHLQMVPKKQCWLT